MNIRKTVFSLATTGAAFLALNSVAFAGTSCQPIYGGGQTCITTGNLLINKQVLNPQTNQMVESLGFNDPRYVPGSIVTFKIILTNSGGTAIQNIQVQDILPQFADFATGEVQMDPNNKKRLTFSVNNLKPNESQSFFIQARVTAADNLPNDKNVVCQTNQAIAVVGNQPQQDNADFCIEKQVAGAPAAVQQPGITKGGKVVFPAPSVSKTPPTGPEALPLLALIPTGLFGYILRKKAILQ